MSEIITSQPSELRDLLSVDDVMKYPDLLPCIEYLILRESDERLNQDQIVKRLSQKYGSLPTTRQGMIYRVELWRRNGTLRKAEEIFIAPKVEEVRAAISRAVDAIPSIIDRLIKDAKNESKSTSSALDILQFLSNLAQQEIEKKAQPGDREHAYLNRPRTFAPTEIIE